MLNGAKQNHVYLMNHLSFNNHLNPGMLPVVQIPVEFGIFQKQLFSTDHFFKHHDVRSTMTVTKV